MQGKEDPWLPNLINCLTSWVVKKFCKRVFNNFISFNILPERKTNKQTPNKQTNKKRRKSSWVAKIPHFSGELRN